MGWLHTQLWLWRLAQAKTREEKQRAARELGVPGNVRAIDALAACAADRSSPAAAEAVRALGRIGDARCVAPLGRALADLYLAREAASALGEMGCPEAVDPLLQALAHMLTVREAAAALAKLGDPRALGPLVEALGRYPSPPYGSSLAEALCSFGQAAVQPLVAALLDPTFPSAKTAADVLAQLGWRPATPAHSLAHALATGQWEAAAELSREDADALVQALGHADHEVKATAARALAATGDPRACQPLRAILADPRSAVRTAAAEALGKLGDARAVEPLIALLADQDWPNRAAAAEALGRLGDPRAVEPLAAALADDNHAVRAAAASALGHLGDRRAVQPLLPALADPAAETRAAAEQALSQLGEERVACAVALSLAGEGEGRRVLVALAAEGDRRCVEPLVIALSHERLRKAAAQCLEDVGEGELARAAVADLAARGRAPRQALEQLAAQGDERAFDLLVRALRDRAEGVARASAEALGRVGDRRAVPPLLAALREALASKAKAIEAVRQEERLRSPSGPRVSLGPDYHRDYRRSLDLVQATVQALGELGDPEALDSLAELFTDMAYLDQAAQQDTCVAACRGLGRLGDPRAAEVLLRVVHDVAQWDKTRQAAIAALEGLIEAVGADIPPHLLHDMATLRYQVTVTYGSDSEGYTWENRTGVDCERLKDLARQELARREAET